MKTMKTIKLPDKPSELLTIALHDLEACERDKEYRIDMGFWHEPTPDDDGIADDTYCRVCFAGGVIAKTGKNSPLQDLAPTNFDEDTSAKLSALDAFRDGQVATALMILGLDVDDPEILPPGEESVNVEEYHVNRRSFKRDIRALIKTLKRRGI